MPTFFEKLTARSLATNSLLCVGLDPREQTAAAARDACLRLIDQTAEYAAAFKANSAFFEVFGADGLAELKHVAGHVPDGVPLILDAKRGDIADTSEVYARAAFDELGADAITVSPYLGRDSLEPFLARPECGAFVLCRTSNPGGEEFQGVMANGRRLYEEVARHVAAWNLSENAGLVVAATDPEALAAVRAAAPSLWFLVPGIGAQGGELDLAVAGGLRDDGLGLLINASRSIARAPDPAAEARRLRDAINAAREKHTGRTTERADPLSSLARDLVRSGCVRFGEFRLKSRMLSPIYIDLRRLVGHPLLLAEVARAYSRTLATLSFERLAGIPYSALPIATAVSMEMNRPMIYPRREAKDYGTRAEIEGDWHEGEKVVVIDDLATTGGTKIEAIRKLEAVGLRVEDIVVLIDREQGASRTLADAGYRLHAVATLRQLLELWQEAGEITREQHDRVVQFLEGSE